MLNLLGGITLIVGIATIAGTTLSEKKKARSACAGLALFAFFAISLLSFIAGSENALPNMAGRCQGTIELSFAPGQEEKDTVDTFRKVLRDHAHCRVAIKPVHPPAFPPK